MFIPALCAAALLGASASAPAVAAEPARHTLTLTTSLGPVDKDDDTRDLRARGTAPRGSRIVVTFMRKGKVLGRERPKLRSNRRYAAALPIDRTGSYRVRVTAFLKTGQVIRVTARLEYGPEAQAPAPPPPPPE